MPVVPFADDAPTHDYYRRRAAEYDDWLDGTGLFADRDRPGWHEEVAGLVRLLGELPPAHALDVACGTGYLTRHLRGRIVGLDQSPEMVAIAQARLPEGLAVVGDALATPFADGTFERIVTGHFYGHLDGDERAAFLREARRLGGELVVVDSALQGGAEREGRQERTLNDGSVHEVYKRYLSGATLAAEIGGEIVLEGDWFVVARADLRG